MFLARELADFGLEWRRIRVLHYAGVGPIDATFDHLESRGYGVAFENLLQTITGQLPIDENIAVGLRETRHIYPPVAIREFLANALIHQDLEEETVQITVEMFDNRVEIKNPGKPLIDVRRFVDRTRTRNRELAEIMRLARICEIRGSGVDRALLGIEALERPAPEFRAEDASTRVVLHATRRFEDMSMSERT